MSSRAGRRGGGADAENPPSVAGTGGHGGPIATYNEGTLPGRLIVTDLDAPTRLFDLRSGLSTSSPWNSTPRTGWSVATGAGLLARTDPGPNGTTVVTRIAFNWLQRRGSVENDVQLWIANVDGTGLRPLTAPPDANSALACQYGSLTWSPDGQWIAGVLYMGTSAGTPITLPPATFPDGSAVAGTTAGCNYNPVFVLPASADRVAIGWPAYDPRYSVKVRKADGSGRPVDVGVRERPLDRMSTPSPVRHGRVGASCRRAFLASLIALGAAGCGGGSGSDTPSPEATAPVGGAGLATYAGGALSGRLIVQATDGPSTAFDLRTGQRHALPQSTAGGKTDWQGGTGKATVLRGARDGVHPAQTLEPLKASDWTPSGATIRLATHGSRPTLSPDGRHVLTFWQTGTDSSDRRLTIFDVATGQPVKRGSALDGQIVTGGPAAWLPDGRYLYLAGRNLYESLPTASASILRATLSALPDNSFAQNNVDLDSNASYLTVSPDGTKIAFTWRTVRRNVTDDSDLWVANVDGSGLRQLTAPVDPASPLTYAYGSPTWSADSQWVAGVLYMNGSVVAPIFPPDQSFPGVPGGIIGATGCATNPVFVLPANAEKVALSWPTFDVRYGVKVLNAQGNGGQWVGACSSIDWVE